MALFARVALGVAGFMALAIAGASPLVPMDGTESRPGRWLAALVYAALGLSCLWASLFDSAASVRARVAKSARLRWGTLLVIPALLLLGSAQLFGLDLPRPVLGAALLALIAGGIVLFFDMP